MSRRYFTSIAPFLIVELRRPDQLPDLEVRRRDLGLLFRRRRSGGGACDYGERGGSEEDSHPADSKTGRDFALSRCA